MNLPTIVIIGLLAVGVAAAVHHVRKRGTCSCKDCHCGCDNCPSKH